MQHTTSSTPARRSGALARGAAAAGAALMTLLTASAAWAFCGVFVDGAGADLFNDATQVALLRDGTRTVLTMQNRYDGPREDFAMVVPVPVVLNADMVRTLHKEAFDELDFMSAPRLVEYWPAGGACDDNPALYTDGEDIFGQTDGVEVKNQFKVGEYDIKIVGAEDSARLDGWLRDQGYNVPAKIADALQPYIDQGMYFVVARIRQSEIYQFSGQSTQVLSPLQFAYDSPNFSLPVRLGLINAETEQDLIIYILAPGGKRYKAANRPNVTIPTNIEVKPKVRNDFGAFYKALFERTLEEYPGHVVTEYAWGGVPKALNYGTDCDPCPEPPNPDQTLTATPDATFLGTLGADFTTSPADGPGWALTRLHARLKPGAVEDDITFVHTFPIRGGRNDLAEDRDRDGKLVQDNYRDPHDFNNFQARYIINHTKPNTAPCRNKAAFNTSLTASPAASLNTTGGSLTSTLAYPLNSAFVDNVPALRIVGAEGLSACSVIDLDHAPLSAPSALGLLGTLGLAFGVARRRRRRDDA